MKFKLYLTEGRSKTIDEEKAKELLKKHCKKALKSWNKSPIYRGLRLNANYIIIDPKSGKPRKSANTANYYTLINDNSLVWLKYPKRSQSIICTTSNDYASKYGKPYTVFPFDGAMIGISPTKDYWGSFQYSLGGYTDLDYFNYSLEEMFNIVNVPINDDSFMNIKNSFKMFDNIINNDKLKILKERYKWMHGYSGDLMEHIQYILSPNNNSFRLVKIGTDLHCDDCEVWTDSKSIMILTNDFNDETFTSNLVTELGY